MARYEFGDFALDVAQQRLVRLDTGVATPLAGKVFDTLLYLVEHAGEALAKDTLLQAIWPGVIVEENSLTQNISTLRQLLGESRNENRYIATLPRKGYRFVATVTQRDAPVPVPVAAPPRTKWWPAGLALVAVALLIAALAWRPDASPPAASQTLAILPFKPLLPAERNEALELGMTESLIARLGRGSDQPIRPLSSVRRYAALDQDVIAAGRALGVDTVLDGSLQRNGDRLRVSVRLLRVADGQQLWADSFDQDFTTIFDVQDAIAARVAQALALRGSTNSPPTRNAEAYALYASGRFAWTRQSESALVKAIDFFDQAIALDPDYALAWTGRADSLALLGVMGIRDPRLVFPEARRAAEKALAIDPNLAEAHSALGHVLLQFEHDADGAQREYERALALDPGVALTHHRRGLLHAMQGDFASAMAASEKAQQLEPLWLGPKVSRGCFLYYARRFDESIALLDATLALDDRLANARACLVRSLLAKGDSARALRELGERKIDAPGSHALRAQALALSGQRDKAVAELARVLERQKTQYLAAYDIALIHATLGENDRALEWLERAMDDRSTLLVFLAQEPVFDALRADPEFARLVERIGVLRP